jgi:hypothetical protein
MRQKGIGILRCPFQVMGVVKIATREKQRHAPLGTVRVEIESA